MTIRQHPTLWCDWPAGCGNWADVNGDGNDAATIRRHAPEAGWTRPKDADGKRIDLCPKHSDAAGTP